MFNLCRGLKNISLEVFQIELNFEDILLHAFIFSDPWTGMCHNIFVIFQFLVLLHFFLFNRFPLFYFVLFYEGCLLYFGIISLLFFKIFPIKI